MAEKGKHRPSYSITLPALNNNSALHIDTVSAQTVPHQASLNITVEPDDLDKPSSRVAAFGYVAGFCAHSVLKVLKCDICKEKLVVETGDAESDTDTHSLTANLNRGGLKFPSARVWLPL